jgi:hypothetical protein
MATKAQITRNRQNAKHSTGPRTAAGKKIACMNAIKHGLTAEVVLLPDEKPVEFNTRVKMIFEHYLPQDAYEVELAQNAAYCSWQMDRCRRAGSARTYAQAIVGHIDEERRQEDSAIELAQILLRTPFGRAAEYPHGILPDREAAKVWTGCFESNDHPAQVIRRLEANRFGVLWLLEQWDSLDSPLQRGEKWGAAERFRACRLLGIHAIDARLNTELTSLLYACQVLDPEAGSVVSEVWGELVSATDLPQIENRYRQLIECEPVMDQDAAREHLIAVVRRQTTRLEERAREHQERAELFAELRPNLAAFDLSHEGLLMLRYESSWRRLMDRNTNELRKRKEARRKNHQFFHSSYYMSPSPGWLLPEEEMVEDSRGSDQDDCADSRDGNEAMTGGDDDAAVGGTGAAPGRSDVDGTFQAAMARNEPKVEGDVKTRTWDDTQSVARNEPKVESDVETARSDDSESVVRNEPKVESDVERVRWDESKSVVRNEPKVDRGAEGRAQYREEALRNEASVVGGALRTEGDRFGGSASFDKIMAGAMRNLERPVPVIRLGISPGFGEGNSGGGSRRERRRRKAEARARGK